LTNHTESCYVRTKRLLQFGRLGRRSSLMDTGKTAVIERKYFAIRAAFSQPTIKGA